MNRKNKAWLLFQTITIGPALWVAFLTNPSENARALLFFYFFSCLLLNAFHKELFD